tara:strand:+ start:10225 stop:11106 length:882 start_codon:yes stop_codon:yes gene_type:complete
MKELLNFDFENQQFSFNEDRLNGIDFRRLASQELFHANKSFVIIKNFLSKETAIKIRDFYTESQNKDIFIKTSREGNSRIFYYLNSPYIYPKFVVSLLRSCMFIKNKIYQYHDYYQYYCMLKNLDPKDFMKVVDLQVFHSWQAVYWYRNNESHFKHIDYYGELACFLILSEKSKDYDEGGIKVYYEDDNRDCFLDDYYEYGDLVFLDQSQVYHEVLPVRHRENQVGRLSIYIPTIPPNYMKKTLFFEGFPFSPRSTVGDISFFDRMKAVCRGLSTREQIHYSRVRFSHFKEML